jgi:membrane protein DedA with SNARE-associated domain
VVGGAVTKRGDAELPPLIVLVWGALVSGDVGRLLLRRRFGRPFLDAHGAQLRIRPEHVDRVGGLLRNRHGGKAVLVGGPQLYTHSRRFIRGPRGGHER